jgi:hypothetical protein
VKVSLFGADERFYFLRVKYSLQRYLCERSKREWLKASESRSQNDQKVLLKRKFQSCETEMNQSKS